MQGNSWKGFLRCRLSCLWHCIHYLSVPLHTDDISQTLFVNYPVWYNQNINSVLNKYIRKHREYFIKELSHSHWMAVIGRIFNPILGGLFSSNITHSSDLNNIRNTNNQNMCLTAFNNLYLILHRLHLFSFTLYRYIYIWYMYLCVWRSKSWIFNFLKNTCMFLLLKVCSTVQGFYQT